MYSLAEHKELHRIPAQAAQLAFGTDGRYLAILTNQFLELHLWRDDDIIQELCNRVVRPMQLTKDEAAQYAKDLPEPTKNYCPVPVAARRTDPHTSPKTSPQIPFRDTAANYFSPPRKPNKPNPKPPLPNP